MSKPHFGSIYASAHDALCGDKDYEEDSDLLERVSCHLREIGRDRAVAETEEAH